MEIGAYTFADVGPGIDAQARLRNLLEEIELAEEVGLDVFGVGEHHDRGRAPDGHLLLGSPHEVADKILAQHELFAHDRFLAQMSLGTLPHANALRSIELLGTEVLPRVRDAERVSSRAAGSSSAPAPG